jgi:hypothetical protein
MSKQITVYTNVAGEAGIIKLTVQGDVWMPIDVQPPSASFSRLTSETAKDPSLQQKLTITNNVEQNAELSNVRSSNPVFKADMRELEPGKKWEMVVTFGSPPQQGSNNGTVELSTNIKDTPTLSIPVSAYIAPDIEVMPPNLALRPDQPTASTRELFVKNNSKTPFAVSEAAASNPDLKVTLEEAQAGTMYKIKVDIPADYKVPPQGDRITFKTTNPTAKEMVVPITAMKVPPAPTPAGTPQGFPAPTARTTTAPAVAPAISGPARVGELKPLDKATVKPAAASAQPSKQPSAGPQSPPAQQIKPAGAKP